MKTAMQVTGWLMIAAYYIIGILLILQSGNGAQMVLWIFLAPVMIILSVIATFFNNFIYGLINVAWFIIAFFLISRGE